MAPWRNQNTTIFSGDPDTSRFSAAQTSARGEAGNAGSRPMPSIGKRCHELRINHMDKTWRIVYHIDEDAIVILEVFANK